MKKSLLTTSLLLFTLVSPLPVQGENLQQVRQLMSTGECPRCDLSNAGLVMADLRGADLRGADLSFANLSQANLAGADLRGANLTATSLHSANLMGANLIGATISGTDLRQAYLANAYTWGTRLDLAYLDGAVGLPELETAERYYAMAAVEANRNNYVGAIEYYNRALQLNPDYAPAYFGRGLMYYRLTDEAAALQDAKRAIAIFEENNNEQGQQAVAAFLSYVEQRNNPEGGSGLGISLLNLLGGLSSVMMRGLSIF
ncbi:pentapeptide repeat-containing protein [Spirulina sp. CS-785/01]|uniref:pentapeptide repeat-containing protein n=1 Tax=Spirulina sp. CS-785/01 TaxID=3021716 RepID=UPI00232B7063|nr:pentapeptide repeat-containing protein [Spirulina sp. CS-785/01]MDB9312470.1 pentapeptide repeat-containing protein [Spirulina sp. CS-785/01]